jgi:hypothetical protein
MSIRLLLHRGLSDAGKYVAEHEELRSDLTASEGVLFWRSCMVRDLDSSSLV